MAYLVNDPAEFAAQARDGFVAAHSDLVTAVAGGVIRTSGVPAGHVAVVIGGGSGHYPAFAGLVGTGLAAGAAMGNIFASPSAQQIYNVAKAAEAGGGVLFSFGNYAGDVLNFRQAQQMLTADGLDVRTVVVTDDISSASPDDAAKRRGVAGGLAVFKVVGAAADAGASLDELEQLAISANQRVRTLGVAFSGCTLPGAPGPLFTVAAENMAVGLGIHGEPGIKEMTTPSADGIAEMLVSELLADVPAGVDDVRGSRIAVIVNGLGSVKGEELFVVFARVRALLLAEGVQIVEPEVGEFVTSFDMAGLSLTLFWLDDALAPLWAAPAYTPAFRKGLAAPSLGAAGNPGVNGVTADAGYEASTQSRALAAGVLQALETIAQVIDANADRLGRLDAIAGDGDHGIGMQRGSHAAVESVRSALAAGAGAGAALGRAADGWADKAGGTSGVLWGIILRELGRAVGDDTSPDTEAIAAGVTAAAREVASFGGARAGDKTLLDVLFPFAESLTEQAVAGADRFTAWAAGADAADSAARDTANLRPLIGRARPLADKSLGTADPGAVSMAMIIRAVAPLLASGKADNA